METPPRENLYRAAHVPGAIALVERAAENDGPEQRVLTGHFAVFNRWTEISSLWEGHFLERIAPGAFRKTLAPPYSDGIRVLFQHGRDPSVGDKPLGMIRSVGEDKVGAHYEVPLFDTSYNRDLIPGLEAGAYGASFRFKVWREEIEPEPEASVYNPDGLPERTIKEAQVMEFGPVTFPAYPEASAGLRSITDDMILSAIARQDPERLLSILNDLTGRNVSREDIERIVNESNEPPSEDVGRTPASEERRAPEFRPLVVIRNPKRNRDGNNND